MLLLLLILCVGGCALLFIVLGNTDPAVGLFGGAITGFVLWLVIGFVMMLGNAFDGCDSLDADDMCVDTGHGEVRP